jgi:Cof subfamily protein (haloacid dehalogenase superfamily)
MHYRLLALDVDGTLLDPYGTLRPAVRDAVMAVQQRGLRVVLCTGRRFRTARPLAQALQLDTPLVVHNGAVVKDPASGQTLQQSHMPIDMYHQALTLLQRLGTPLVYIDAFHENVDILTESLERAHPLQRAYLTDQLAHCRIVDDIASPLSHGVISLRMMADSASLQALQPVIEQALGTRGRVHLLMNKNYQGYFLEILQAGVSKWQAVQHLAAQQGIAPDEIIAVGDDHNDLDMLRYAGLGIAMGNAVPEVLAVAAAITGSNAEDGLVQALERFILRP